ncbi:MAG: hypothetical protein MJ237_01615 [bacterium]|nr:hypothetical protein [bacterium]
MFTEILISFIDTNMINGHKPKEHTIKARKTDKDLSADSEKIIDDFNKHLLIY